MNPVEVDVDACMDLLAASVRREFPLVVAEKRTERGLMATGWFTEPGTSTTTMFVTISFNRDFSVASEGAVFEQTLDGVDPTEIAADAFREIEPWGRFGVSYVRAIGWLGPASPSAFGYTGSPDIERWKRYRFAKVVREVPGWTTRAADMNVRARSK